MLDRVNCKVLSTIDSEHVDAYLLSESSMFVFPHKLILKTCGTTTLLLGLRTMLRIAARDAGFPSHNAGSEDSKAVAATPYRVFYSRKNFLFPDKQHGPHKSWKSEISFLDDMFTGGSAYLVGKMNGDHWYLYLTSPNMTFTPPRTPDSDRIETKTKVLNLPTGIGGAPVMGVDDETLEVLMTDLDPENAKQFYLEHASAVAEGKYARRAQQVRKETTESLGVLDNLVDMSMSGTTAGSTSAGDDVFSTGSSDINNYTPEEVTFPEELTTEGHALGKIVSENCGLSDVYPTSRYADARVDAFQFSPCGFSANGVIPAPDQAGSATHYFTVHVTPEPHCSYASFETNVPGRQSGHETVDVIKHVVNIFKPGRMTVTLFEAKASSVDLLALDEGFTNEKPAGGVVARSTRIQKIEGFHRIDCIRHEFDGYDLVFQQYERDGWEGGRGPRVGEPDI